MYFLCFSVLFPFFFCVTRLVSIGFELFGGEFMKSFNWGAKIGGRCDVEWAITIAMYNVFV